MAFTAGTPLSASALNDAVGYTAPTSFTITTPAGTGWYRIVGSLVEVHGVTTANASATTAYTVYTLPVGYRPAERTCIAAAAGAGPIRPAQAIVDPNGDIQVYNAHTTAVPIEFHGLFAPA